MVSHDQGAGIDVVFDAGNFTGYGSMTWTVEAGDQTMYRSFLKGRKMTLFLDVRTTTVGGTPSPALLVAIPGGFTSTGALGFATMRCFDNGTASQGTTQVGYVAGKIGLFKSVDGGTNWSAATNATTVQTTIEFEVT
jgi:hypothetical protein